MKISNRVAIAIIRVHGYSFFCAFRNLRRAGYGMKTAMQRAGGNFRSVMLSGDDDDAALGFDVVGAA